MAQTYSQVAKQIAALQARAERLKQQEVGDVIARIRKAIDAYGITAEDLFGKVAPSHRQSPKKKSAAKYSDGNDKVWVGRGPRPQWLRDALAKGKSLSDFLIVAEGPRKGVPSNKPNKAAGRKSAKTAGRNKAGAEPRARFTDGTNIWGGRGPQPRWFKDAVAAGKSVDELRIR